MKRTLPGVLLRLLASLSFGLCVAVTVLWVRRHRVAGESGVRRADDSTRTRLHYGARIDDGRVVLFRYRNVAREQWVYDFFERRWAWRESHHHARQPSPAVYAPATRCGNGVHWASAF